MKLELWQAPLLVMAVLVAGHFAYAAIPDNWSEIAKLRIKMIALGLLAALGLGIGYQLLQRAELSVLSTLLAFLMLAIEGLIAWIGWQQLQASKAPRGQDEGQRREHDPAV
jgi:hypothetical protein